MSIELPSPNEVEIIRQKRYDEVMDELLNWGMDFISKTVANGVVNIIFEERKFNKYQWEFTQQKYGAAMLYVDEDGFLEQLTKRIEAGGQWTVKHYVTRSIKNATTTFLIHLTPKSALKPQSKPKLKWWQRIFK